MSQSIPRMTAALSSGTVYHQTVCAAPDANKILSLANLVLNTLNFFPSVIHFGSLLMVVSFTACTSAALIKLCIMPESIKTMLQCTHYIAMGNSKSCNSLEQSLPNAQAP